MKQSMSWDQETKDKWLATMRAHQKADRLIQGRWILEGAEGVHRGCFFGCAMQTDQNPLDRAIEAMHLPAWIIYMAENIFEGLPRDKALRFPVELLEAIPVDTDLHEVRCKIVIARLEILAESASSVAAEIYTIIDYYKQYAADEEAKINWLPALIAAQSAADSASTEPSQSAVNSAANAARAASTPQLSARAAIRAASHMSKSMRDAVWSARSVAWTPLRFGTNLEEKLKSEKSDAARSNTLIAEAARLIEFLSTAK